MKGSVFMLVLITGALVCAGIDSVLGVKIGPVPVKMIHNLTYMFWGILLWELPRMRSRYPRLKK